jgi:hypothetical protein
MYVDIGTTSTGHKLGFDPQTGRFEIDRIPVTAVEGVESVVAGTHISVNNSDPQNPVISTTGLAPLASPVFTTGIGANGNAAVTPSITGALSTVTDTAAQAVLTSIIAALDASGIGLVTDATT